MSKRKEVEELLILNNELLENLKQQEEALKRQIILMEELERLEKGE